MAKKEKTKEKESRLRSSSGAPKEKKKEKEGVVGYIPYVIIGFLIVAVTAGVIFFKTTNNPNTFAYGVSIAGQDVGGKSYDEVKTHFQQQIEAVNQHGLSVIIKNLEGEKKEVKIPAFVSGLTSDRVVEYFSLDNWEETIQQAYQVGKHGMILEQAAGRLRAAVLGRHFVFAPAVRQETIVSLLESSSQDLPKASDAHFVYENGEVKLIPEVVGQKINASGIAGEMSERLSWLNDSPMQLSVKEDSPKIKQQSLEPFLGFAKDLPNGRIVLRYKDHYWNLRGRTLVGWLTLQQNGSLGLQEQDLQQFVSNNIALYIDSPMRNSRFQMIDGQLTEISDGQSGNVVDVQKTLASLDAQLAELHTLWKEKGSIAENGKMKVVNVNVETTVQEPAVTKDTITKYRITDLVGTATTNFAGGSADRQHNIETGVAKITGILIAPGAEFSTVMALGDITEEAGFVKEYVIKDGKTDKEIGGGLCQLATTLFRTALDAGMEITERTNHRYVIPYYGAGLDATIYDPHPDFRFINDTGNYLLLQGKAHNNEVTFELYGQKDGRVVEIGKPVLSDPIPPPPPKYIPTHDLPAGQIKCTEIPHDGVTADTTYTVTYANGQKKETKFHSVYQPWQKVCLIGDATVLPQ